MADTTLVKNEDMDAESTPSAEAAGVEDVTPATTIEHQSSVEEMDAPDEDTMSTPGDGDEAPTTEVVADTTIPSTTSSQEAPVEPEQQAKYQEARKIEQSEVLNGSALNAPGRKRKTQAELANLSTRNYLDETVVPTLLVAMSELSRARPEKPLEWLGKTLLRAQERQDIADRVGMEENGSLTSGKKMGQGDEESSDVDHPMEHFENGKSPVSAS